MPLVIKNNTLPHLKGLNSIWDPKLALGVAVILWVSCLLKKCSFHIIGTQTSGLFCSQLYLPFLARCYCEKWWDSLWCQFETRRIYGRLFRTSEREKYGQRIITSAETLKGWLRLKWRPFFFIPHSFGVCASRASSGCYIHTIPLAQNYYTYVSNVLMYM